MPLPTLLSGEVPQAGVKWADILSYLPTWARMSNSQALAANSTVLQNVTALTLPVVANYEYDGWLIISSAESSGNAEHLKVGFTFPAGATFDWFPLGPNPNLATGSATDMVVTAHINNTPNNEWFGSISGGVFTFTYINFTLLMGATPGNLQVQASQVVSGANVVTVGQGSKLMLQRMPS